MPRIAGVEIPGNKKLAFSLRYLYGIGTTLAFKICQECGLNPDMRANELKDDQLAMISSVLDKKYIIEGQLRRQVAANIARLRKIGCYRGIRHAKGLPVRGQRTKTNARTRKGPRVTVANKKSVKEMR